MRGGMFCCMCSALVGRLPFMARGSDALFAASVVLLVCIGGLTFLACACAFRGFLLVSTTRQLPCLIVTQGNQGRHDPHHHLLQFLRALLEILGANPGARLGVQLRDDTLHVPAACTAERLPSVLWGTTGVLVDQGIQQDGMQS